jgi:siroheme synthase
MGTLLQVQKGNMIRKILIVILVNVSLAVSEDVKNGFEIGIGLANSTELYLPVTSLSVLLIKDKGISQITTEINVSKNTKDQEKTNKTVFGSGYSYLFKIPIPFIYLGPTIGLFAYSTEKSTIDSAGNELYDHSKNTNGIYAIGIKTAAIFGRNIVRLKIEDRLLLGRESSSQQFLLLNNITVSVVVVL